MKFLISYFYQVRNLPFNHIPVSTAMGDPTWYHGGLDKEHQFYDKRKIWNGIRYEKFAPYKVECAGGGCACCSSRGIALPHCEFLDGYRAYLDSLDWEEVMADFQKLETWAKQHLTISNPVIVLMVHEATSNPCSERRPLIDWFQAHGIILEEFKVIKGA